ncbi:MAG TPA: phosphatidylglycerophosphatase A [Acidobacteriota bacterium]|nr:phosphatidylglycerophosphatase A [Acidobacteriota bacterium]
MELLQSLEKKRVRTKGKNPSLRSFSQLVATGFGLGYLPIFPGTWGSIATAVAVYGLYQLPLPHIFAIHIAFVLLLFPLAWYCSEKASRAMDTADPSVVVIDEVFGQALALLFVPVGLVSVISGLALFRIFDIFKPFPVSWAERLRGGLGIVADDLIAGVYAGLVLLLLHAS